MTIYSGHELMWTQRAEISVEVFSHKKEKIDGVTELVPKTLQKKPPSQFLVQTDVTNFQPNSM